MKRIQPAVAGFEDRGRGPQVKECRQPLEAGKGQESGSFLEPPGMKTCQNLDFSPMRSTLDFGFPEL